MQQLQQETQLSLSYLESLSQVGRPSVFTPLPEHALLPLISQIIATKPSCGQQSQQKLPQETLEKYMYRYRFRKGSCSASTAAGR